MSPQGVPVIFSDRGSECVQSAFHCRVLLYSLHVETCFCFSRPPPVSAEIVKDNSFSIRITRKIKDTGALGMYKH